MRMRSLVSLLQPPATARSSSTHSHPRKIRARAGGSAHERVGEAPDGLSGVQLHSERASRNGMDQQHWRYRSGWRL
jgi:hypothetical protein